jgi:tetratricopeptide (TPR) repeat protein
MVIRLLLILAISLALIDDGAKEGRKGNNQYQNKDYTGAAASYQEGLRQIESGVTGATVSGLHNNLGSALNRLQEFEQASDYFRQAVAAATGTADLTRAAYNAGNNAFQAQDMQVALDYYKKALLADPNNEEARFNYEFVKRMAQNQEEQQQGENSENQQNQDQNQNQEQQQEQQQEQEQNQEQPDQEQNDGEQNQDPGEEEQQNQDQNQEQQQEPDPDQMSRAQAERILQALQTDEKELLKQVRKMKGRARKVDKDW